MGKLLAIDGLHILRRLYEARPESDSSEKTRIAVQLALGAIRRLLETHDPTHAIVAFDDEGQTWRHAVYPAYRAKQQNAPVELKAELPEFEAQLSRLGLQSAFAAQAEADDVIATAVRRWLHEQRGEAVVVSGSRRLLVLLGGEVRIWDATAHVWHDADWVQTRYGVGPAMVPDLLAMTGNPGNGVPGIARIGQKTAARLLCTYGDLDRVMAGAGILLDALGQKLRAGREAASISRALVQLKADVHLGVTWKMLQYAPHHALDSQPR